MEISSILDRLTTGDGELFCGVCGKPKRKQIDLGEFGGVRFVNVLCDCDLRQEAEEKQAELARRRDDMRRHCFRDKRLYACRFEADNGKAKKLPVVRKYAEGFRQMISGGDVYGMLLSGGVGSGKSFAACCVCNYLIDEGVGCRFTDFTRILSDIQTLDDRNEYFLRLKNTPLLVIDDFGAERDTSYAEEIVFRVINDRVEAGKPMIITTNIPIGEIRRVLESDAPEDIQAKRVYSRIDGSCVFVEYTGPDMRKEAAAAHKKMFAERLGL